MKKVASAALAVLVCGIWGCDNRNYGRFVGFAIDGQTGQKLNFFKDSGSQKNVSDDSSNPAEIYAIVNGAFKRATPCGAGDANSKNGIDASGCFKIDGLPINTTISVVAQYPGYQSVLSSIYIQQENTISERLNTYVSPSPQTIGNFRLFPVGFTIDYKLIAVDVLTNAPVANATVTCTPTASGSLSTGMGSFLSPELTLTGSTTAQTDPTGIATLPGTSLMMGATYSCDVYATTLSSSYVLSGTITFTAGVTTATIRVALNESSTTNFVEVLSSNNQNPNDILGGTANLVLHFNQPVEIVPNTVDCQRASFGGQATQSDTIAPASAGKFTSDIMNNGQSETAAVTLSADGLIATLSPRGLTSPPDSQVLGTTIQFDGIYFRATGGAANAGQAFVMGNTNPFGASNTACKIGALEATTLQNLSLGNTQPNTIRLY